MQYHISSVTETSRNDSDNSHPSNASVRIHRVKPYSHGATMFPKLDECAHFHYEIVELQQIEVYLFSNGQLVIEHAMSIKET